jgi:hypothetical protein
VIQGGELGVVDLHFGVTELAPGLLLRHSDGTYVRT